MALPLGLVLIGPAHATNLLVVVLDDIGADKVGAYADVMYPGTPTYVPDTPELDGLASVGLLFTDAWASPVCSPTRAGLLTGRFGFENKVGQVVAELTAPLPESETTLPEVLTDPGLTPTPYTTGLFGKWHLGLGSSAGSDWTVPGLRRDVPNPGLHGFDVWDGTLTGSLEDYYAWTRIQWPHPLASTPVLSEVTEDRGWNPEVTVGAAVDWIAAQDGPWFAMVSLLGAHTDEEGPANKYELDDLAPGSECVNVDSAAGCANREIYATLVHDTDAVVAELLAALRDADPSLLEDTVVVVTSDNGTQLNALEAPHTVGGERQYGGKSYTYEAGVRVPLIVARGCDWMDRADGAFDGLYNGASPACAGTTVPMAEPGLRLDAEVMVVDLFPTLTELAGASLAAPSASISLVPCLSATSADLADCGDPALSGRTRYTEHFRRSYTEASAWGTTGVARTGEAALKHGDFKLVARVRAVDERACLGYEFYDLSSDPWEYDDLLRGGNALSPVQIAWYSALTTHLRTTLAPDWLPVTDCA